MFSMCSKVKPQNSMNTQQQQQQPTEQLLWKKWAEEWVVLYDDSTMAWFTEPGRSSPSGKILVKEAPEMLAIAHWTGQIPRRPPLPEGCSLPPPPQIELVVDKPHLMNVLRRPLVRIRPATSTEVKQRKALTNSRTSSSHRTFYNQNPLIKSDAAVAILSKKPDSKASLSCPLTWGHGWGWATLPNGVWSGGLTWSQCEDTFTLHALPTTHCTNLIDTTCSGAIYHTDIGGFDFHSTGVEDLGGEDFDYAMDCGDFIF
uniref:PH domain-containing protein n=1 Tax=Glossina brevipalpis TaxID=37001 RepID=A0A1A9X2K2_9MUSC